MKIVIVGGGTAGWLTAYYISSSQPKVHDITVIEPSKIGILGVGESGTGLITGIAKGDFFPRESDFDGFVKYTNASNKMGINFINWNKKGYDFFSPLDGTITTSDVNDIVFKYVLAKYGNEKIHVASKLGMDFETGKNFDQYSALHFDAHKTGQYFKKICLGDGVKCIDSVVSSVKKNLLTGDIKKLVLKNGEKVEGDLFIDCSGFRRVLMKEVGVKWRSFKKHLPMNSALPFFLDYESGEQIEPWTTATAMSSGWMWTIPLQNRKGCGYVYNDKFITPEQAQEEVEKKLNKKITPLKPIKFDPGRGECAWKNNVVSMGVSSAFMEPLQATSIHTTIAQIILFVNDFLLPGKQEVNIDENRRSYNKRVAEMYDLTSDFVSLHYQGGRTDTKFWRWIKDKKIVSKHVQDIIERSKYKVVGHDEIGLRFGVAAIGLWHWTIAGLDLVSPEVAERDLKMTRLYESAEYTFNNFMNYYNRSK